jgi:hypothetical protein
MPSTRKQGDASAVLSYQEDPNPSRCVSTSKFRLLCLFVVVGDCLLNFATLAFVGLALKWDLTFGDEAPHRHPHVPEENYIQRPNNLLSIIMISTSLNFAESIVLLVFYCCNMRRPPSFNPCYRSLRVAALFYSWLCIVLVGMSNCLHRHLLPCRPCCLLAKCICSTRCAFASRYSSLLATVLAFHSRSFGGNSPRFTNEEREKVAATEDVAGSVSSRIADGR